MVYCAAQLLPSLAAIPSRLSSPTAAQPTAAQPTAAQPTAAQPTAAQPTAAQPTAAQPTAAFNSHPASLPAMVPDPSQLREAAAAAGVETAASNTQALLAATAKQLRVALDAGADADHASVASLLALAGAALRNGASGSSAAFGKDAAAVAEALGVEQVGGGGGGDCGGGAGFKGNGVGVGGGEMRIRLRPAAAKEATEKVLGLVRRDVAIGRRVEHERGVRALRETATPVTVRRKKRGDGAAAAAHAAAAAAAAGVAAAALGSVVGRGGVAEYGSHAGRDNPGVQGPPVGAHAPEALPNTVHGNAVEMAGAPGLPRVEHAGAQGGQPQQQTGVDWTGGSRFAGNMAAGCAIPQQPLQMPLKLQPHQVQQLQQMHLQLQQQQQQQTQQEQQQHHNIAQQRPAQQQQEEQQFLQTQGLAQQQQLQLLQTHAPVPTDHPGEPFVLDPAVAAADEAAFAALQAMDQFMAPLHNRFGPLPPTPAMQPAQLVRSVLAERERVLYKESQQRQAELVAIPPTMPEEVRRKAIIEGKQLRLLELQRIVRFKVAGEDRRCLARPLDHTAAGSARGSNFLPPYDDLARLYHRHEPPVYSYTDGYPRPNPLDGVAETPERSPQVVALECHRMAQFDHSRMAKQRADKRLQFSRNLLQHHQEFSSFHGAMWTARNRAIKGFQRHFMEKKRAEEKRKKQEQVERLRLLRNNDEEAYLKLLKNTKNERLLQLVSQTDNYLTQIGAKVEQTRDVPLAEAEEGVVDGEETPADGDTVEDLRRRRNQYYSVTHSVRENVAQPSIMVNGKLKPYQIDGLRWMVSLYNNNLNGILADEMGLGKTIQTISLITYLIEVKQNPGPYLIIVPLSTLGNWVREFDKWAPSVVKIVYRGDGATRRQIQMTEMYRPFNVLMTTYEFVVRDQQILGRTSWKYIIIDEGHRMKNASSKMALTLAARYRSRNRLLLTGTPLQNNLTELWALLNFLLPNIFASADTFEQWFKKPFEQTTMGDAAVLEEEETYLIINRLHQVLRPFLLRRLKTDVESQLPDKVETVIRCDMSVWQRVLYRQMQKKVSVATGEEAGRSARRFNNLLMQLRKICNHPFLFYDDAEIAKLPDDMLIRSSGKFVLLAHMLAKLKHANHRTLIFSQMTTALDYLEDFLTSIGVQYLRLDGNTKSEERQGMLNDFNAPDSPYFCFLLSTRAGGLGLNLQTADTVIIFDSDWNPMMDLQAQDRAHRIGQTNEVRVIRLISAGTVEVKILDQANRKLHVDAQVIQAGQFNNKATDTDRETMLKSILRTQADDSENMGDRCPDKEEVNRMVARSDEEFEVFQKIDEERGTADDIVSEESDLPAWVLQPEIDHKTPEERAKEEMLEYGRGRRRRAVISDVDQLTESEWVLVMEGRMTVPEVFERRERRTARRRATLGLDGDESDGSDKNGQDAASGSDEDNAEFDKSGRSKVSGRSRGGVRRRSATKAPPRARDLAPNKRRRAANDDGSSDSNSNDEEREQSAQGREKRRRMNGSTPVANGHRSGSANVVGNGKLVAGDSDEADMKEFAHDRGNADGGVEGKAAGSRKAGGSGRRRRRSVAFADEVPDRRASYHAAAKPNRGNPGKTVESSDGVVPDEETAGVGIASKSADLKSSKAQRSAWNSEEHAGVVGRVAEIVSNGGGNDAGDEETDGGADDAKNDEERCRGMRTRLHLRVRPPAPY